MGQVRQQVEKLGVARRVAFLGSVADVRPVLAAADASVLASTSVETFSMAMLESMAMERPVIGSDIGGMSEAVVPGETGLLVRPGDVDGLREAVAALVADREARQRVGRAARAAVLERFGAETMVRRTRALLEAVVAGRGGEGSGAWIAWRGASFSWECREAEPPFCSSRLRPIRVWAGCRTTRRASRACLR
jgi:glycosyltransferase involved in cell wall biosynthesis